MTEPIYVRYVYLTEKGLKMLEALDTYLDDLALERIPRENIPPTPPRRMRKSEVKQT